MRVESVGASHGNGEVTMGDSTIIPPLYILLPRVTFYGEQLGAGKAMKLVVSRAVSRAGGG